MIEDTPTHLRGGGARWACIVCLLAATSAPAADTFTASGDDETATVLCEGLDMWRVRATPGSGSALQRARTVAQRLQRLFQAGRLQPLGTVVAERDGETIVGVRVTEDEQTTVRTLITADSASAERAGVAPADYAVWLAALLEDYLALLHGTEPAAVKQYAPDNPLLALHAAARSTASAESLQSLAVATLTAEQLDALHRLPDIVLPGPERRSPAPGNTPAPAEPAALPASPAPEREPSDPGLRWVTKSVDEFTVEFGLPRSQVRTGQPTPMVARVTIDRKPTPEYELVCLISPFEGRRELTEFSPPATEDPGVYRFQHTFTKPGFWVVGFTIIEQPRRRTSLNFAVEVVQGSPPEVKPLPPAPGVPTPPVVEPPVVAPSTPAPTSPPPAPINRPPEIKPAAPEPVADKSGETTPPTPAPPDRSKPVQPAPPPPPETPANLRVIGGYEARLRLWPPNPTAGQVVKFDLEIIRHGDESRTPLPLRALISFPPANSSGYGVEAAPLVDGGDHHLVTYHTFTLHGDYVAVIHTQGDNGDILKLQYPFVIRPRA